MRSCVIFPVVHFLPALVVISPSLNVQPAAKPTPCLCPLLLCSVPRSVLFGPRALCQDVIPEDAREDLPPSPSSPQELSMGGSGVPGAPVVLLSSLNVDAVCERVKQIDGMDPNMLSQYTTTIKKANVNGRVLYQCNLDELKKEMDMNFGDWQLFRGTVMDWRQAEAQALQEDCRAGSEQGSSVLHGDPGPRRSGAPHHDTGFSLNLSFEELSTAGLEEPPRNTSNTHWPAPGHRTSSMSSLNSQESSNDICKLTDKQQAEYRDAYREYVAQMAQLDLAGSGGERPVLPLPGQFLQNPGPDDKAKEGADQEGRKPFPKRGAKPSDTPDFPCAADGLSLDPISEEDEKLDHSSSKPGFKAKGAGPLYHKLPSDEDSGPDESSDSTPLLQQGSHTPSSTTKTPSSLAKVSLLPDLAMDKKDSSDSGVRSEESSSVHSLEEAEGEEEQEEVGKASLIELELEGLVKKRGLLPSSLSGLQDPAVARMSICSEAASEASLMASSPDETWPVTPRGDLTNLNRSPSNTTLNNNTNNSTSNTTNSQQAIIPGQETSTISSPLNPSVIITPGSSTDTVGLRNQNLRGIILKRGLGTDEALGGRTRGPDTIPVGEERESVL